eukprot:m.265879 g.265879  ORF g.265879 m.265879 type:complete len:571 (-) comp64243_c0_seq1:37-1749(-)
MSLFRNAIAQTVASIARVPAHAVPVYRSKTADFTVPISKLVAKGISQKQLVALAQEWSRELAGTADAHYFQSIESNNNQLLFNINKRTLAQTTLLNQDPDSAHALHDDAAAATSKRDHVVIEFSSPNIAKPFHAGHLRSTIIGGYLARLHENRGFQVTKINYLGDWGKQFGLLGVGFGLFGCETKLLHDPIRHLFDVYVKTNAVAEKEESTIHADAREYFQRLENGGEAEHAVWSRFRELSIISYNEVYKRLGIDFDIVSGESMYGNAASEVIDELREKSLLVTEKNGAELVDLSDQDLGKAIVRKKDGTTVYLSRDIAAAKERHERLGFDRMIYVAGAPQNLHFKQLFTTLRLSGHTWAEDCQHVNFGMIHGMSSRRGTVVFLDDILNEATDRMLEILNKNPEKLAQINDPRQTAAVIGLSAVVIQDLKSRRIKDYHFDWDRILQSEGDTGPFLQYTHARLLSIERLGGVQVSEDCDLSHLDSPEAEALVHLLSLKDEILDQSLLQKEPTVVVQYLFRLARQCSKAIAVLRVKGAAEELARPRVLLFSVARRTIGELLRILGLEPLERV